MNNEAPARSIKIPKRDEWPGTIGAYKTVEAYLKPQVWNLISVFGMLLIFDIIIDIALGPNRLHEKVMSLLIGDVLSLIVWSFFKATLKIMYFSFFSNKDMTLSEALGKTRHYFLPMLGLSFITLVVLMASFIFFVVPFFFILPRIYLAPYFLIKNDIPVNQAIASSWHSTKGNVSKVYGIIVINVLLFLLCITIVGIPFAIYLGMINSGSFALLTLYLSQPKNKTNLKSQTS